MQGLIDQISAILPSPQVMVFGPIAAFVVLMALLVAVTRNLFHNALALVGTLFGVAALYALMEAEFVAVSQILVYIGAISTLITFAIMLTRGMMFGRTSSTNRQMLPVAIISVLLFLVLMGLLIHVNWPQVGAQLADSEQMIADIGELFVTTYLIPFELMALMLLVALAGAILLARDN